MVGVSATETVAVLTSLAAHRVDVSEIRAALGTHPEITRRADAVCATDRPEACRVFGATWWKPAGAYAGYRVCLVHEHVEGPIGPLADRLPLPREPQSQVAPRQSESALGLVLVPLPTEIAWVLADARSVVADGSEPLRVPAHDSPAHDAATQAGAWLHQLLITHRPRALLIVGEIRVEVSDAAPWRLGSIGIEVRTRYIDAPLSGYQDFLRMERVRGMLQGVAFAHCGGCVYMAPLYRLDEHERLSGSAPPEIGEAFRVAASSLVQHFRQEGNHGAAS
jgi:hypothetical protein